jgi:hypothetical protein
MFILGAVWGSIFAEKRLLVARDGNHPFQLACNVSRAIYFKDLHGSTKGMVDRTTIIEEGPLAPTPLPLPCP